VFDPWRRTPRLLAAARTPRSWLAAMTGVGLIGGGLAISRATETDWPTLESVSHLGIDPGAAAFLTVTLLGLGIGLLALGMSLEHAFASLRSAGRLSLRAERSLNIGFILAGVGVSLTGLFRMDGQTSILIHSLAGFTTPVVLMATMVGARVALGDMGRRFDGTSAVIVGSVVVLFAAAYRGYLVPFPLMELICFALIGAWLWFFEARLRGLIEE
jgi:hypothetical protein